MSPRETLATAYVVSEPYDACGAEVPSVNHAFAHRQRVFKTQLKHTTIKDKNCFRKGYRRNTIDEERNKITSST